MADPTARTSAKDTLIDALKTRIKELELKNREESEKVRVYEQEIDQLTKQLKRVHAKTEHLKAKKENAFNICANAVKREASLCSRIEALELQLRIRQEVSTRIACEG